MPKVSRLVEGRNKRLIYLTKYALIHPDARNVEYLCMLSKGTFSTARTIALDDARTVLARIQTRGDQYGISPESHGKKVVSDVKLPSPAKVRAFGAGFEDPEEIKPLTPEEEDAIRKTPLIAILATVDRKVPRTDFHTIEEE